MTLSNIQISLTPQQVCVALKEIHAAPVTIVVPYKPLASEAGPAHCASLPVATRRPQISRLWTDPNGLQAVEEPAVRTVARRVVSLAQAALIQELVQSREIARPAELPVPRPVSPAWQGRLLGSPPRSSKVTFAPE